MKLYGTRKINQFSFALSWEGSETNDFDEINWDFASIKLKKHELDVIKKKILSGYRIVLISVSTQYVTKMYHCKFSNNLLFYYSNRFLFNFIFYHFYLQLDITIT